MQIYDIAVVGAGPAGAMAAIRAGQLGKNVILIERNTSIGKKILLTGKGRCNITNAAPLEVFIEKFGKQGKFLRSAFSAFFNKDLINFFKIKNLELINERQGRVFPADHRARSVVETLTAFLADSNVKISCKKRLLNIRRKRDFFELNLTEKKTLSAKKVILSTGGLSYRATGSTGDGFRIAREMGHTVIPLRPSLVPLRTKETWVKDLEGLPLKNIRITFSVRGGSDDAKRKNRKNIVSPVGEIMFTHFGVSGPLVLDLSDEISSILRCQREICLFIDLKPALDYKRLERRLLNEFKEGGNRELKTIMKALLPQRLVPVFIRLAKLDAEKRGNQIVKKERDEIIRLLKALPLTITGTLSITRGMVTGGGVSTKEIDPRTMESKIIPGLYFAGEIIDGSASSGGYNLQQAFSTGYLAGNSACVE